MRIKFRAWHTKNKCYLRVDELLIADDRIFSGGLYYDFDELIVEQYTGINDANNVEIYEGDIVSQKNVVGYVAFLIQRSGYAVISANSDLQLTYSDWQIIGNIYENKELLK